MVLVVVTTVWFTCSIPISLLLGRVMSGPPLDLYGLDGMDGLCERPGGTIERFALIRPTTKP
jgi:hypothetical protein